MAQHGVTARVSNSRFWTNLVPVNIRKGYYPGYTGFRQILSTNRYESTPGKI